MELVERRIGLLFALFLALLALAGLRAGYLGVVKGGGLASVASSQQQSDRAVPARRGAILDRHGTPLATSEPADDVSATPYLVKDPVAVAAKLAPILGLQESTVARDLARRDTGFVYLARRLPADKADRVKALGIEGIDLTPGYRRAYPRGMLASQVIGAVGTDGDGLFGLEYAHDRVLRGRDGEQRTVYDGGRDAIDVEDVTPTVPGARLRLTLDAEVQARTEEVLQGVGETYQPKGASAVVMDPRSGEVLAMANWPRINANDPGSAPAWATQNRAVGFTFEPGSTFKAFTVAGALEDGEVTPSTSFALPPTIQVADRVIGEAHDRGPITLDTAGILAQSSNVGSIMIGQRLGARRFDHWVRRFGFGRPTGIALPGEEQGVALALAKYSGSSMGNLPIGQGELVTPIQMASAYAAIANGGVLRTPQIIGSVDGRPARRAPGRRVVSSRTAAELRRMLEGVLAPGGTASEVQIPGYRLAGKTGTANKVDAATGTYSEERYIASFVGMAPAQRPRLLVSVMVDEPKGAIYGGDVAAPAFGKIASFALPYLRIPPA
jgi:cell division protein FtsI/penicillin-binding protein 2